MLSKLLAACTDTWSIQGTTDTHATPTHPIRAHHKQGGRSGWPSLLFATFFIFIFQSMSVMFMGISSICVE